MRRSLNLFIHKSLIVLLFFCFSCMKKDENLNKINAIKLLAENTIGKKIFLPKKIIIYKPFGSYLKDSINISKSELKVYAYINASCSTCLNNIKLWDKFALEIKDYGVPVILILQSYDEFELFKYLCEKREIKKFPYPFFFDQENSFVKNNKFMIENETFRSVLTDKENNIIMVGNPFISEGMKKLYIKEIKRRRKL
ncbi:Redoxin [Flavobacterium resistens]|nr:redoxin family protein [Flavobacterium resistens]SMO92862.1 Redoxin [Flavobacterium resistens]